MKESTMKSLLQYAIKNPQCLHFIKYHAGTWYMITTDNYLNKV